MLMKSENKHFKTRKSLLTFCKKILDKSDKKILILGDELLARDIQQLQPNDINSGIPIEEDIIDIDDFYNIALIDENYIELIDNYNIKEQIYIISCDELLDVDSSINNKIKNNRNNEMKTENYQEEDIIESDIDDYITEKVEEILSTDGCPECIKDIIYNVFYSGIATEKSIQLTRLQEELGYFQEGFNGDEND